jgi:hypothetical protein
MESEEGDLSGLYGGDRPGVATVLLVALVVVGMLVGASIFGVWKTFTAETERQETSTFVEYSHGGEFDYDVYVNKGTIYGFTPQGEQSSGEYYRNLIDTMDVSFSYTVVPQATVGAVFQETVTVSALLEHPGVWKKTVTLVPEREMRGPFVLDIPLDLDVLENLSNAIEFEIGKSTSSNRITLIAEVHVVGGAGSTVFEDDFVQRTTLTVDTGSVSWQPGLTSTKMTSVEGLQIEQRGQFDYALHVENSILFGNVTFGPPEELPGREPIAIPKASQYFVRTIDHVDGSFSYGFDCEPPPSEASASVEVTAVLSHPGTWSKSYVLVPETRQVGDFTVEFPIDLDEYMEAADAIRGEIGMGSATYDLEITADVHMAATTDYGAIDERFSQSFSGRMAGTTVVFDSGLRQSQRGFIRETVTVAESVWPARAGALVALLALLSIGAFLGVRYLASREVPFPLPDTEARWAKKKRGDIVVDVGEMPVSAAAAAVVPVDSLDELLRVADSLLKPVLHNVDAGQHTYWVIDGATAYRYQSGAPLSFEDRAGLDELDV